MKKGFTLIELLSVIIILAIILVIAVPKILNIIDDARDSAYSANESMFVQAAKLYLAANSSIGTGEITTIQLSELVSNKFIKEIKDTKTGVICDGVVEVQKSQNNDYKYIPYLECDSKYELQHYSDSIIKLTNPKGESLQNLKLYGNSVQTGTPTIVLPIQISSVGDSGNIKIISTGKNLLNKEEAYNIAYNYAPTRTSMVIKDGRNCIKAKTINTPSIPFNIKYKSNTQYTIQMEYFYEYHSTEVGLGLYVKYTDNTYNYVMLSVSARENWYKTTFVSTANKTIQHIHWTYNGDVFTYINYDSMLIYEGNDASPIYEPFRSYEYTINLSQPLRSLPDGTKDYIDFNNGKIIRNVGSLVSDGSSDENWGFDDLFTGVRYFYSVTLGTGFPMVPMLSNRFVSRINKSGQEEVSFSGARYLEIGVLTTRLSSDSVAAFKTWLSTNQTEILYKLKAPVEELITLPSVLTNRGITTLYTADVRQPIMEFDVSIKE